MALLFVRCRYIGTKNAWKSMKTEYMGYRVGDRIELVHIDDIQAIPVGTKGTIHHIDDIGQLHMRWDNGRTLSVNLEVDEIKRV